MFKAVLPPALLKQLDLPSAKWLKKGSFVDERLRWRHTDLLYSIPLTGRETLIYVLWEKQSRVDPLMPLRLLIYMARIWDYWLRDEEARRKKAGDHSAVTHVPPILPVVLYQGPNKWNATTEFLDVIDLPGEILGGVREYMPSFRFVLDDLSENSDKALRLREIGNLGKLCLLLLKHARDERDALLQYLGTIVDLVNSLDNDRDRVLAFSYILEVTEVTPRDVTSALGPDLRREAKEAAVTGAEMLRLEGERRVLLRLLRKKFSPLSPDTEERVASGSAQDLVSWTDRVMGATSLEAVFATEAE